MIEISEILGRVFWILIQIVSVVLIAWFLFAVVKSIMQIYVISGLVGGMTKKQLKRAECKHENTHYEGDCHDTYLVCDNCRKMIL